MRSPGDELDALDRGSLRRRLYELQSPQGARVVLEGREMINFSSNDYLGLSVHPKVLKAFCQGVEKWGAGAGSSRLISGSLSPHMELEAYLAELKGKPAAKVFANGYATAVGTLSAVLTKQDVVIMDKLSHASLIDGAKLSSATLRVFPHNNMEKLESLLSKYAAHCGRVMVVTEAVFSMDGDIAPLAEVVELKNKYGALLLLDEAHALGVRGPLGLADELSLADEIDFHMGTLGKAAGVAGGYVTTNKAFADLIINRARAFIYSTAPPPAQCLAALESLALIVSEEGEQLRKKLWRNIALVADQLAIESGLTSAIIPWHLGGAQRALDFSAGLKERGMLVPAIRYPTVARDQARLRATFSASHSEEMVRQFTSSILQME